MFLGKTNAEELRNSDKRIGTIRKEAEKMNIPGR